MNKWISLFLIITAYSGMSHSNEEAPVIHADMLVDNLKLEHRPWRAPDYSNQEKALGWTPSAFAVMPGLEEQVAFWLEIYTKYTTHQGVFHDSEYINFIYEEVDFNDIESNTELTAIQKENARQRRVKDLREKITSRLEKLHKVKSADDLTGEDLRLWKMFEPIKESDKFLKASRKGRLRFQLGQKDRFILGIYYSGRYLEDFEEIFKKAGLPIELTRMVFVESSFNIYAQSRVGASGLWQIMPFVGRNQLMMNASVDDRNHPWHATELAAKILKQNYRMLEDWSLAVSGYNHGAYGIRRLTRRYKVSNMSELLQNAKTRGSFGFASQNFYASFLAALEAEKNAEKYFGKVTWSKPLPKTEITLPTVVKFSEVLEWFKGDATKARLYNPHVTYDAREGRVHIPPKATVFVESSMAAEAKEDIKRFSKENRKYLSPQNYKVARGDTLSGIANKFNVSVRDIMRTNNIKSAHRIRIGQSLKIPHPDR